MSNLVARCKQIAATVKKLKDGGYRYTHSKEILLTPKPSSLPFPKQPPKYSEKERLARIQDTIKQKQVHDTLLRDNPNLEPAFLSARMPTLVDPMWTPREETVRDSYNLATLEYHKQTSLLLTPEQFLYFHQEEKDPVSKRADEERLVHHLETLLKREFDLTNRFDYHDDGYYTNQPLFNFIMVDLLKLRKRPEKIRYYAGDWAHYGGYHYPKRTYFKNKEEKQKYKQIYDWTFPNFNLRTLFHPNGRLNFDYQPPPWELPVPFALGLPHLDDKIRGTRMHDVYTIFGFTKPTINLLDVHREFVRAWKVNVSKSPYIAAMLANARIRAQYNLRGPPVHETVTMFDFSYHFSVFWSTFKNLFISNQPSEVAETPKEKKKKERGAKRR